MPDGPGRLDAGVAGRALPGEQHSGDLAVLVPHGDGVLAAVIDGLGHGADAAAAATTAAAVLEGAPGADVAALIDRCHAALRKTRGAVMTVAWFDLAAAHLRWVGVGNVEARLLRAGSPPGRTEGPLTKGGVVGFQLPDVRVSTTTLADGDVVVLATDGIAPAFSEAVGPGSAQANADRILERHARASDDALVVVLRHLAAPARPTMEGP